MDKLLSYGSCSDTDEDEENTESEMDDEKVAGNHVELRSDSVSNTKDLQTKYETSDCPGEPNVKSKYSSESQFNFFSLPVQSTPLFIDSESTSTTDGVNKNSKFKSGPSTSVRTAELNSQRKNSSTDGDIDVPEGDFWAGFNPTVTTLNGNLECKNPHNDYYDWQMGTQDVACLTNTLQANKRSFSSDIEECTRIRDINPKKMCYPQSNKSSKHKTLEPRPRHNNTESTHSSHQGSNAFQKRKLFFVHSKISPYLLNSSSVSKCPRVLSHSWPTETSTINRINWNIPQYSHLLLTAGSNGVQGDVTVWNAWSTVDNHAVTLTVHKKSVKHAEWLNNGRAILSCSFDRTALITDVESETVLMQCDHAGYVTTGCCHPSNQHLFLTGTENMILMWDRRIKDVPVKHFSHKNSMGQIQDLLLIQDGRELISCSDVVSRDSADKTIIAWDMASGVVLSNQIFQERYSCIRLKRHPNNEQFLAQTQGGYIAIFSASKPYKMNRCKRFEGHKSQGYSIGFDVSSDGQFVYSGSAENGIHCYDWTSGRSKCKLSSSRNVICDVACHPVLPSVLAACTWGGTLSIWR